MLKRKVFNAYRYFYILRFTEQSCCAKNTIALKQMTYLSELPFVEMTVIC